MRSKNTTFDFHIIRGEGCFEMFYERFRECWRRSICKAGTATFADIRVQGKLGNDEGFTANIEQGTVHLSLVVSENAQVGNFLYKWLYLCLAIALPDAE